MDLSDQQHQPLEASLATGRATLHDLVEATALSGMMVAKLLQVAATAGS